MLTLLEERTKRGRGGVGDEDIKATELFLDPSEHGAHIIPVAHIGLRGDGSVTDLLTLSQVVLALQLPFAMFPLLHFTSSRKRMGSWRNGWLLLGAGWTSAILIAAMDLYGLPDSLKAAWQVIVG